jgi:hypothetical protein
MGKARRNSVQVDFDILEKRMAVLGISKASISERLGYSKAWFYSAKINGGRLREKDAREVCDLLGLKPEDVIVPEKQPGAVDADVIKLTTPIAIDQADAIVTGLADIVSEAVSNQTVDIVEGMDALADAVVQLTGEVKRGQDLLRGCLLRIEKVLDKMEELKQ